MIPGTTTWARASAVHAVQHSPVQSSIFATRALNLGNSGDCSAETMVVRRSDPVAAFPLRCILAVSSNRIFDLRIGWPGQGDAKRIN